MKAYSPPTCTIQKSENMMIRWYSMRKATIGILVLLGLLLGMAFVPFSQAGPGMDEF